MNPLRAIVADDSLIFRKVVRDCLAELPDIEVIDVASDGSRAVEKICRHQPDLVTLDVEMPGLDGLEVLKELRSRGIQTEVIMVSSHTDRAANSTTSALSLGAFDYILKPNQADPQENRRELVTALGPKVEAIRRKRRARRDDNPASLPARSTPTRSPADMRPTPARVSMPRGDRPSPRKPAAHPDVVLIGVSTGGPAALRQLLPELPADFPLPILIVQHMPPLFTASLARDLDANSKLHVCEATHQQHISPGTVYIAPGGKQMRVASVAGQRQIEITDDPPLRACKPSVDYLFTSAAKVYGAHILAVILTGMGNDGTAGCEQIVKLGGRTIAQNEASCTVFGMPRQLIDSGLADRIEPLSSISNLLVRAASKGAKACL